MKGQSELQGGLGVALETSDLVARGRIPKAHQPIVGADRRQLRSLRVKSRPGNTAGSRRPRRYAPLGLGRCHVPERNSPVWLAGGKQAAVRAEGYRGND